MIFSSESTGFLVNRTLNLQGRLLDLTNPKVMGILNVTPDSFYDGDRYIDESTILKRVSKMVQEGASIIDIGGHSSRPGAIEIIENEETKRVLFAIKTIRKEFPDTILSLDTFRSNVAKAGFYEGVNMINDVSGGNLDPEMFATIRSLKIPYILMHMRGNPSTMATLANYENVAIEVLSDLRGKVSVLEAMGVKDILVDPGFGFAKNIGQNFELLTRLKIFKQLNRPILVGISRKSMIWKTLKTSPEEALNGTSVLHTVALAQGASLLRVHDVKEAVEAITLFSHLKPIQV